MTTKSGLHDAFLAARLPELLTGVAAATALLVAPWSAAAHTADSIGSKPHSSAYVSPAPILNGAFTTLLEQHTRSGGGGGGGGGGSRAGSGGGGGGQAVPRGGSGGGAASGGATSGGSSGGRSTLAADGSSGGSTSTVSGGSGTHTRSTADSGGSTGGSSGGGTPTYSRPRDGQPATGTAVERGPGDGYPIYPGGGGGYYPGGYYPWGWGGLGIGAYYGYSDPWGWYDPYPAQVAYGEGYDGALKLKVKPRQAEVYVDGYFAGAVDDYDGSFQKLRLEPGPHRIELRLDGYEPLTFEIRIQPDRTVTYKGEMRKTVSEQ